MRLHRFYLSKFAEKEMPENLSISADDSISADLINQLTKVFRYKIGQQVVFFNQTGFDYVYEITEISKNKVDFVFVDKNKNKVSPANISLAFSLIKKDNAELVIQKCTELGVIDFFPLLSERTEKKNFDLARAQKIAIEAVEQSGRDVLPKINSMQNVNDFVVNILNDKKYSDYALIVLDGSGEELSNVKNVLPNKTKILALVGPEGGWSESELEFFRNNNVYIFKLEDFVLRAETAAISIVAGYSLFDNKR